MWWLSSHHYHHHLSYYSYPVYLWCLMIELTPSLSFFLVYDIIFIFILRILLGKFQLILPLKMKIINYKSKSFSCLLSQCIIFSLKNLIMFSKNIDSKVHEYQNLAEKWLWIEILIKFLHQLTGKYWVSRGSTQVSTALIHFLPLDLKQTQAAGCKADLPESVTCAHL